MAKKKDDGSLGFLLVIVAFLIFLPFLIFSFLRYRKLKRIYNAIPNIQRVFDTGKLYSSVLFAVLMVVGAIVLMIGLVSALHKNLNPSDAAILSKSLLITIAVLMIWPMKKMAERVAVEYFGIIFNDNDNTMILPADISNISFGDLIRLKFLRRLGEQDRIAIGSINNITREKGVNFYIHGGFGSRRINFSNKQKRDECLSALQARAGNRGGRDYGY
ncbi:hypothetical protein [Enterobacter sp.]|uniref:hypothetical protein n=1 Tax=Enterobacter sp. TaxID=42895 RepID=UPI00296E424B|nr:hypothetical protein [Enterobacter sp.]